MEAEVFEVRLLFSNIYYNSFLGAWITCLRSSFQCMLYRWCLTYFRRFPVQIVVNSLIFILLDCYCLAVVIHACLISLASSGMHYYD